LRSVVSATPNEQRGLYPQSRRFHLKPLLMTSTRRIYAIVTEGLRANRNSHDRRRNHCLLEPVPWCKMKEMDEGAIFVLSVQFSGSHHLATQVETQNLFLDWKLAV